MTDNKQIIAFEGTAFKLTKEQYDTFVASISTQNPTKEEIKLHLWYCDSKGVNVLDKLIYFTKRKGRYVPITSIDYMRIRAESSGSYAGSDDATFVEGNKSKYPSSSTVTVWKYVQGKLGRFTATARWEEYAPDLNESSAFLWKKMPKTMLAKCAEALALRKAFPGQLHGLYVREELAQDGRYVEMDSDTQYRQENPDLVVEELEGERESEAFPKTADTIAEVSKALVAAKKDFDKEKSENEGWTVKEILGNKHNQMTDLLELTSSTAIEIATLLKTLDATKKYSLLDIENMLAGEKVEQAQETS